MFCFVLLVSAMFLGGLEPAVAVGPPPPPPPLPQSPQKDRPFHCHLVDLVLNGIASDQAPLGKGYAKAAWRGLLGSTPVVVKAPHSKHTEDTERFRQSAKKELGMVTALNCTEHIVSVVAHCLNRRRKPAVLVRELGPSEAFLKPEQPVMWCARLHAARRLIDFIEWLSRDTVYGAMIHCDMSFGQFGFDHALEPRLLDLNGVHPLGVEEVPYWSHRKCVEDRDCDGFCYRWWRDKNYTMSEFQCSVRRRRYCSGFGTATSVFALAQELIPRVLGVDRHDAAGRMASAGWADRLNKGLLATGLRALVRQGMPEPAVALITRALVGASAANEAERRPLFELDSLWDQVMQLDEVQTCLADRFELEKRRQQQRQQNEDLDREILRQFKLFHATD